MSTKVGKLRIIEQKNVGDCTRCGLHKHRKNIVFGRGDANAALMFVGEAPGEDEDEQGLPFVGKAGQLLDQMIVAMGWSPETVYIANILKCRPPENRYPTPREVSICAKFVRQQIGAIKPAVLVTLGNLATKTLLDETRGIMSIRGNWRRWEQIPVMPTYHPAFVLRQPSAKRPLWKDAQAVVARLKSLGHPPPFWVQRSKALS